MSNEITFTIDGVKVKATAGQTILNAADAAGIYIPRLCWLKDASTEARCRVCTVLVNGRPQAACVFPASNGLAVQNNTPELQEMRKQIIEMLFVEGNHFCMFCEMSGKCELQALGYRFGMMSPRYPFMFPKREVDASHPDAWIDHNRCILCGRCVAASSAVDKKNIFQFVNRGIKTKLAVNSEEKLGGTKLKVTDRAMEVCPVGALLKKRAAYTVPIGRRLYDKAPIGSEIEAAKK